MSNDNTTWTDERIEKLKKYWADGLSAGQIAARLSGVSRNAVIGKARRIGLAIHVNAVVDRERKPAAPKVSKEKMRVKTVSPVPLPVEEPPPIVASVVAPRSLCLTLMELESHHCRWPYGERAPFTFCGHGVESGDVYCTYHSRIAYVPREVREKKRAA